MRLLETVLPELALRKRLWADGPLMLWVRADGRTELVAITDGYRESMDSGAVLLRDGKRRGRTGCCRLHFVLGLLVVT